MNKKTIIWLLFSLITLATMLNVSSLPDVSVSKKIPTTVIHEGDVISVEITIANGDFKDLNGTLYDMIPLFAGYHAPNESPIEKEGKKLMTFDRKIEFKNVFVPVGGKQTLTYSIIFEKIPEALKGRTDYLTRAVLTDQDGATHYSNSLTVNYSGKSKVNCNFNLKCEPTLNEKYATCPQDCPSGSSDGLCDQKADLRCDPDCPGDSDPDCSIVTRPYATCGNGVCDSYESNTTCPTECLISAKTTTLKGLQAAMQKAGGTASTFNAILVIVIILLIFLIYNSKRRHDEEMRRLTEDKERLIVKKLKERLRDGEDPKKLIQEGYEKRLINEAQKKIWSR